MNETLKRAAELLRHMSGAGSTDEYRSCNESANELAALAKQIAELEAQPMAQDDDCTECDALRSRMTELLTRTANALRGDPPPLTLWGWEDLPERAAAAIAAIDVMQRVAQNLAQMGEPVAQEAQPVAVIGDTWTLLWHNAEPVATIVNRHGLKIGSKLYALSPDAARRIAELDAELTEARKDAERLKTELRVSEDALQRALRIFEVPFDDCCADTGTIIPAKVEHLVSEAKMRIQRRPDPAKGAPRPAGHNPVA